MVKLHHGIVRPKLLLDLLQRHHLARALDEHQKDLKGLLLKTDLQSVLAELSRLHIEFEGPELHTEWDGVLHKDQAGKKAPSYSQCGSWRDTRFPGSGDFRIAGNLLGRDTLRVVVDFTTAPRFG